MENYLDKQVRRTAALALVAAGLLAAPARAAFIENLAIGKTTFATSALWAHSNLVKENLRNSADGTWHFTSPYPALPYYGGVDLAGAGNTVSVGTVRIFGLNGPNPTAWTLQSRDSAADPFDGLGGTGWTDTGLVGGGNFYGLTHTFPTPVDTRALRFNVTTANASNDRFGEIQVFATNPHVASVTANLAIDPVLSRSDNVPLVGVATIGLLRDDTFNNQTPGGVTLSLTDAVMNYDYTFPKPIYLDGVRFYFEPMPQNWHATSLLEIQVWQDGAWTTLVGGTQWPGDGLNSFDFTGMNYVTDSLRIKHTAYDTGANPRSQVYAYEIEVYGALIPEPASAALLALGGLALLRRRRQTARIASA